MKEAKAKEAKAESNVKRTHLRRVVETIFADLAKIERAERTETIRHLSQEINKNVEEVAANLKQTTLQSPVPEGELISPQYLNASVAEMARAFSRFRKIEKHWGHADALDYLIPSTPEEMLNDLLEARGHFALNVLKGVIPFKQISPESYNHLEGVWLRRVKQILAYYYWRAGSLRGADEDFDDAACEIRGWLLERERSRSEDFDRVEEYLKDKYLAKPDLLDETRDATQRLIKAKAHRIWQTTGERNANLNWFRARLYVKLFYENIIDAVRSNEEKKIAKIFEAFEFSKCPHNSFLIINAFEAALAIEFLDKEVIERLVGTDAYDMNMVSVDSWPPALASPKICNGRFTYRKDTGQIIYEGKMTEEEKQWLLDQLEVVTHNREAYKVALDQLYAQSQQVPFVKQIL